MRDWKKLIEEQAASGQSGVAFCRERDLPLPAFYKHRKRIASSSGQGHFVKEAATAFV